MQQLGYNKTDFSEIRYWNMFRKTVEKIQDSLKSEKNNGYFNEDKYEYLICIAQFFLSEKYFVQNL